MATFPSGCTIIFGGSGGIGQLLFQGQQGGVLELGGLVEVILPFSLFYFVSDFFNFFAH